MRKLAKVLWGLLTGNATVEATAVELTDRRSGTRVFRIDGINEKRPLAGQWPSSLPRQGDPHPTYGRMVCVAVDAECRPTPGGGCEYTVRAEYAA